MQFIEANEFCNYLWNFGVYRNNLKNRFFALSAYPHNFHAHLRLANLAMVARSALLSLENFEEPPRKIPDSSSCFGVTLDENFFLDKTSSKKIKQREKMFPSFQSEKDETLQVNKSAILEENNTNNPNCTCHTGECGCEKMLAELNSHN